MLAVVYICLLFLLIDTLRLLDKPIGYIPVKIKESPKTPAALSLIILVFVTLILIYGTWNARNPVVSRYELNVDKKAGNLHELKIAMVSDIHYGATIDAPRLNRMVETLNELQPDLILLAGDIVDGSAQPEAAKALASIFKQVHARFGIYAVPGNHDRWSRSDNELSRGFKEAGVSVLKDELTKIDNDFYIAGRDDRGHGGPQVRKGLADLLNGVDPSLPLILLDHQPTDLQAAEANHVDLQLSGHTHKGQIFPAELITARIYEIDHGLLSRGNYRLIVSSGYGTWGPPLRIGTNPEVVYVKMNFR